jgi:hypothetical protein
VSVPLPRKKNHHLWYVHRACILAGYNQQSHVYIFHPNKQTTITIAQNQNHYNETPFTKTEEEEAGALGAKNCSKIL